jgi:uncharacterized protein with NAD-binding domain and iron-sulfur cluster
MTKGRRRVAILGGGMAGLTAAWRLSEPGWRDEFATITVYQRGWRLGGKGASSRGPNGRIEEHGLHVWLGWYENAFRLLRQCYEELDRPSQRPESPVRTLADAMIPSNQIGLCDRSGDAWLPWVTDLPGNDRIPGDPGAKGRDLTLVELVNQASRLIAHYFGSPSDGDPSHDSSWARSFGAGLPVGIAALGSEAIRIAGLAGFRGFSGQGDEVADEGLRRTWCGVALATAALRGIVADRLMAGPRGLGSINDEEYLAWLLRHGGPPELMDFSIVRSLYDMVFGFVGGDPALPSLSAGTAVLFGGKTLFDYRGSIFWKMAAGMGDIVFAPLYEALDRRGVRFEFFHRVDALHPAKDGKRIEAITIGRQARLVTGRSTYDPLVLSKGLPCFPAAPRTEQLANADGIENHPLESHWCEWPDAERRVLREGVDFDVVIFAIPPGMAAYTCAELAAERPEWRDMLNGLGSVATQSFQVWLRASEGDLGWSHPGSTLSSFKEPFSTWASMPQLIDVEEWPTRSRPRAIGYFCGALDSSVPSRPAEAARQRGRVRDSAIEFLEKDIRHLLPGTTGEDGFRWELLCADGEQDGPDRFESQFWTANTDLSDRYVQSLPGTDRVRLRSDESGYDNLFLAGDWTDSGLNAGCIEAAVLSGLQAANAVQQRPRQHRVDGYFMP